MTAATKPCLKKYDFKCKMFVIFLAQFILIEYAFKINCRDINMYSCLIN